MYKVILVVISMVCIVSIIFFHAILPDINSDYFIIPMISIIEFYLLAYVYKSTKNSIRKILLLSAIIRFLIMLWNVYGREIYCLPGIGTDTEHFFSAGSQIASDLSLLSKQIYGSYYSKYLGVLFYLCGNSYLLASYINYLCGVFSIIVIYKTLNDQDVSIKAKMVSVGLISFGPINMIICSSLRREAFIFLFVSLSLMHVIKWYRSGSLINGFSSLTFVLLASVLHAGIIGVCSGYIILILFYSRKKGKWHITVRTFVAGLLILISSILIVTRYANVFLAKLYIEDEEDIFFHAQRAVGDAAYLRGIRINTISDFIRYIPIKIIYFLFSPMPWNWRGINDIIAFGLDSIIYILLAAKLIKGLFQARKNPLAFALSLSSWASITIYRVGCGNSANAMRHRMKVLSLIIAINLLTKKETSKDDVILL